MRDHNYYVYITASFAKVLYVGMTNNLELRIQQHRSKTVLGFTSLYNVDRLAYYEHSFDVDAAIAREKQIKKSSRAKKITLIESMNPEWEDLSRTVFVF